MTTMAFVACEEKPTPGPDDNPNALTSLAVSPSEVTLNLGEEMRLAVTPTPAGAVLDSVVWATSDTNVVVVNENGVITAVGYGEANVTASCGSVSGACAVKVLTYLESLSFTQAVVWDVDTTTLGSEVYDITVSDGSETFKCYLAVAELWLCADGFIVNDDGYLDGGVYASYIPVIAPMYYGTKFLNPEKGGVQFVLGEWAVAEVDSLTPHIGAPGAVDEEAYMAYMAYFVDGYNTEDVSLQSTALAYASTTFSGTLMRTLEYVTDETTGEGGYYSSYIPDGLVTKALLSLNGDGASAFMCGMDYNEIEFLPIKNEVVSENEEITWGCDFVFNEDFTQITLGNTAVQWDDKIVYKYGEMPAAEAQRKMEPLYAPVMKIDYPEVAERIEKQLKSYNTLLKK